MSDLSLSTRPLMLKYRRDALELKTRIDALEMNQVAFIQIQMKSTPP